MVLCAVQRGIYSAQNILRLMVTVMKFYSVGFKRFTSIVTIRSIPYLILKQKGISIEPQSKVNPRLINPFPPAIYYVFSFTFLGFNFSISIATRLWLWESSCNFQRILKEGFSYTCISRLHSQ